MPRRYIVLLLVLVAFSAVFLMIAFRRQAPVIPGDDLHVQLRGRGQDCMTCHGPGGSKPRGPNHPFGNDCGDCHFRAGEAGQPR